MSLAVACMCAKMRALVDDDKNGDIEVDAARCVGARLLQHGA